MFKKLSAPFINQYQQGDYLTYTRASLLFKFQVIFICLVVLIQVSMLFAGWEDFIKTLFITPVLFIGGAMSMYSLRKGRYLVSANIIISFGVTAVAAGLIREPFMNPEFALTSYIFFVYPCLALCTIFSTPRFLGIITSVFIITVIAVFMIIKSIVPDANVKQLIIFLNNTIFSFILFFIINLLITRVFDKNVDVLKNEAARNQRNNDFIKKVLGEGSDQITASMEKMSSKSDFFSQNTQTQASSIEEITGTLEEISAGIDNVSFITETQNESITGMTEIQKELSELITQMDSAINESLRTTEDISQRAQAGEQAMRLMEQNIEAIKGSSHEMTNIVSIINDISEQINLLSLNAAIEAARAGEAGRGFAVVADEISKLAERTATSIKDIEALIRTNDIETGKGMQVINGAVDTISTIIDGVASIKEKINSVVSYKDKQIETNKIVNESTENLKNRSKEITLAAQEQKNAVSEIIRGISDINEISQSTSQGAEELFTDSREMVSLVSDFQKKIREYSD